MPKIIINPTIKQGSFVLNNDLHIKITCYGYHQVIILGNDKF